MKNSSTKILGTIVFMLIAIPQVAFAAWWNPFTWNIPIFNRAPKAQVQQVRNATTTQNSSAKTTATTTKKETTKPLATPPPSVKKTTNTTSATKPSVPPIVSDTNNDQPKPQIQNSQPVAVETWEQQEVKDFAYADARGWTSLISTNALGEKRYYRKEGTQWVRNSGGNETSQPYIAPVTPPTAEELAAFNKWCREVPDACKDPKTSSAYETNLSFRKLTNGLISRYNQAQQAKMAQKRQLECTMAPTPEDERVLDPATQSYLRKLRCGTATSADETNYELSKLNSKISDIEYRLKNNQTFSSSLINEIPKPSQTNKWGVQWTGDGAGFITNSSGGTTYFQCLSDKCFSL